MNDRDIVLPYEPREAFKPFHYRNERFAIGVAHRRAGKTVAAVNDLIRKTIFCPHPNPRGVYVAPLFVQAKDIAWSYLKQFAAPLLAGSPNESELRVDLVTGGQIRLYGADNPDRMRGLYVDHAVLDEFADMRPSIWPEVIRPALSDREGGATFIGTPKGRNVFHQLYERGQTDPDWHTFMLRASETGILPAKELAAAALDMTPEQYAQEFECSFDAAIMGAYYGKDIAVAEREGRITQVPYDPTIPVYTSWDLGIGDSTVIWFFQVWHNQIRIIDWYENHGYGLDHYASVVHSKPYKYETDFVPHDARVRELGTGRTRVETMLSLGLKPRVVPEHKVDDGIQAARLTLPKCWFDANRCKGGLEALRHYQTEYDEKARAFKNTPKHDWTSHTADAFRYLAMAWREMAGKDIKHDPIEKLLKPRRISDVIPPIGEPLEPEYD